MRLVDQYKARRQLLHRRSQCLYRVFKSALFGQIGDKVQENPLTIDLHIPDFHPGGEFLAVFAHKYGIDSILGSANR